MAINLVTVPDLGTDFELDTSNQKINVNIDGTTLVRKEDGTLGVGTTGGAGQTYTEGEFVNIVDGAISVDRNELLLSALNIPDVNISDAVVDFSLLRKQVVTSVTWATSVVPAYQFDNYSYLTSFTGASVTTIDDHAFSGTSLTSIDLPKVTSIGDYAFSNTSLTSISLPEATSIGAGAFSHTSLTSISLPEATSIGTSAFSDTSLTSIDLPKVTSIGASAFFGTSLTSISLPEATSIGDYAFFGTSLTSISLPEATSIGDYAFYGASLTSIDLPKVTSIGDSVFSSTRLTSVSLPEVTSINLNSVFSRLSTISTLELKISSAIIANNTASLASNAISKIYVEDDKVDEVKQTYTAIANKVFPHSEWPH